MQEASLNDIINACLERVRVGRAHDEIKASPNAPDTAAGRLAFPLTDRDIDEIAATLREVLSRGSRNIPAGESHQLAGLRAPTRVTFDAHGVAHIQGQHAEDVYFVQGYVTAGDRLWQMDFLRRVASGRAAEVLGSAMLESDRYFLPYGFSEVARRTIQAMRPDVAESLVAFANGVNRRIEKCRTDGFPWEFSWLGYEPEPWSPVDTILLAKLQAEALSNSWLSDILRQEFVDLPVTLRQQLFTETSPLDVVVFGSDVAKSRLSEIQSATARPRDGSRIPEVVRQKKLRSQVLRLASLYCRGRAASNNWVLSGTRTQSGAPILANDPHLQVSVPGIWHMTHLSCPGLDVAGVTIPGIPGILIGHNADLAWGVTNVGADVQDVFREQPVSDPGGHYMTPHGPEPFERFEHSLRVRSGLDSWDEQRFTTFSTRHGPVVFQADGVSYALSWPALDADNQELPAFYDLNRATNFESARAALRDYRGPPQNFVFACRDGDIGAQIAGCVIERAPGKAGLPRDGATSEHAAPTLLEFDRLPSVRNPDSGLIITANNRTIGLDFPYLVTHDWSAPYRARRIFDLFNAAPRSDIAFSLKVQADTFSFADANFVTEVLRMARKLAVIDDRWRAMLRLFSGWEGSTDEVSVATSVSAFMRRAFARRILANVLDQERIETYLRWDISFYFIDRVISEQPLSWLPDTFDSYERLVLTCFDDAVIELTGRAGPDPAAWQWGRIMGTAELAHPLSTLFGVSRSGMRFDIPNRTGGGGPTIDAGVRVSMRFVADLADWDLTRLGLPLGQSGDVTNSHFDDQLQSWRQADPPVFVFTADGQESLADRVELLPDGSVQ